MLREVLSNDSLYALLATMSHNEAWNAARKSAEDLSLLPPGSIRDEILAHIAELDSSLSDLEASGCVNPIRFTVCQSSIEPNPAARSQDNWTALGGG